MYYGFSNLQQIQSFKIHLHLLIPIPPSQYSHSYKIRARVHFLFEEQSLSL